MAVRARDAAGNWSGWNSLQVQTSGVVPLSGSQTAWLDVNNDGIGDEIVGAQSSRFSYYISAWSTTRLLYTGYTVNNYWVSRATHWPNGDQNPTFSSVWSAEWYTYPSAAETQVYFDLNFNLITEAGYDYRLFMDTTDSTDTNPANWSDVPHALGILNWPEGGYHLKSWPNVNADVVYGKRFFFVRLGKPIGSLNIGSAAGSLLGINVGSLGTVTVPGLGVVSLSGFGRVLLSGGASPVLSVKDVLDKVIHAGPKVIWEVWDLVTNTKLNLGGIMTSLDLGVDLHGRFLIGAKLDDQAFLWFELELERPAPPITVVSRDKFLAGSITVPTGADQMEVEFVNTTSGESLGRYGSLLGGGATKIYNSIPEILSDADVQAGGQPASQKVWFVKDPTNQRKLSFYTCFNEVGTVELRSWKNGERIGGTTHELVAAQDFADWIVYVDNWVRGVDFTFPGSGPSTANATSNGGGIHALTRACLIPIFTVIAQVEGMEALTLGLFDGAKTGLKDDWEMAKLVRDLYLSFNDWAASRVADEIIDWRDNPLRRARELMAMSVRVCEDLVFAPLDAVASLNHELSTWEGFKNRSWATWHQIRGGGTKTWTATRTFAQTLADGFTSWMDDFSARMMRGSERTAFQSAPWHGDELANEMIGFGRLLAYSAGYYSGYLGEQVALGIVTGGGPKIALVLVRGGQAMSASLATKTSFAVASRLNLLKKSLKAAALSVEMRIAIHTGLTEAARTPLNAQVRTSVTEIVESALSRGDFDRAAFNIQQFLEKLAQPSTNLQRLGRTPGREKQVWCKLADYFTALGNNATANSTKGWGEVYERSLRFDGAGNFLEDRSDDFLAFYRRADGTTATASMRKSLEEYFARLSAEGPDAKFWVRDYEHVFDKLYHYSPSLDRLTGSTAEGFKLSAHSTGRGWYVSPNKYLTREEAASLLQLPDPSNGRYRIRFSTVEAKESLKLPKGAGNADPAGTFEPLCRDFPDKGFGGGKQLLLENRAVLVDEVFDTVENRVLSSSEIQVLISQ